MLRSVTPPKPTVLRRHPRAARPSMLRWYLLQAAAIPMLELGPCLALLTRSVLSGTFQAANSEFTAALEGYFGLAASP